MVAKLENVASSMEPKKVAAIIRKKDLLFLASAGVRSSPSESRRFTVSACSPLSAPRARCPSCSGSSRIRKSSLNSAPPTAIAPSRRYIFRCPNVPIRFPARNMKSAPPKAEQPNTTPITVFRLSMNQRLITDAQVTWAPQARMNPLMPLDTYSIHGADAKALISIKTAQMAVPVISSLRGWSLWSMVPAVKDARKPIKVPSALEAERRVREQPKRSRK